MIKNKSSINSNSFIVLCYVMCYICYVMFYCRKKQKSVLLSNCSNILLAGGGDMEDVDPRFVFKVFRKFVGKKSKEILSKEAVIEGDQVTKV